MINETEYKVLKRLSGNKFGQHKMLSNIPSTIAKEGRQAFVTDLQNDGLINYVVRSNSYELARKGYTEIGLYESALQKQKVVEEHTFDKLIIDTKNAKRVFSTYWWTFSFSIAALLISLGLLLLKLLEKPQ